MWDHVWSGLGIIFPFLMLLVLTMSMFMGKARTKDIDIDFDIDAMTTWKVLPNKDIEKEEGVGNPSEVIVFIVRRNLLYHHH